MAEEFGGNYSLVFRRSFLQLRACKRATVKLHIVGTVSFLNASRRGLKESQQTPYLLLRFGSWVKLKVQTLDLSGFPVKFTMNLKAKYPFIFLSFLELTNSAAEVINFISDNFPDRSTIMMAKNSDINIPLPQQCFVQFV